MIHVDPRNTAAGTLHARLVAALPDLADPGWSDPEVDLVIGGDGFMLQTLADGLDSGRDRTMLGLNAGRIGFLMNDTEAWDRVIDGLTRRAWTTYTFPTLRAQIRLDDGSVTAVRAINDVAVERSGGQTAHLAVSVDGRRIVDRLVADGLIVSTALGSTAYTFSAGGPAAHPTLRLLAVTAVSPHHPRLAPFLLPDDATVEVAVHDGHRRPVRIVADGQSRDDVLGVHIGIGPDTVRLAWLDGHDHTARIVAKILRP